MHTILEGYSPLMAVQDFLPVILSSIGLFFLARMAIRMNDATRTIAWIGWALITLGGLNKAIWKLIMAATNSQTNLAWLDDSLFVLMGPGFVLLATAIGIAQRRMNGRPVTQMTWLAPNLISLIMVALAVIISLASPASRTPFYLMLVLTTIGNFILGGLVIQQAMQQKNYTIAALFAINLIAILLLTGMARVGPGTISLEWTKQIINTFSNVAFVVAAYKLAQLILTHPVYAAQSVPASEA
jgi:hypothetical protein